MSKYTCLAILYWGLLPTLLAQGPISGFMPQQRQLDVALTRSWESYDAFLDDAGQPTPRALDASSYNLFVEYGNHKTTLVASLPYIRHDDTNKGLQDAALWLKFRNERTETTRGYQNWITAAGLAFPASQYPADNPLAIGRQAAMFSGRLLWQYEAKQGWFVQVQSGVDFQFAPTAQAAVPVLLRGGFGATRFYVDGWLERYQAVGSSQGGTNLSGGAGSSWTRVGGTFYVPLLPWVGVFSGGAWVLGGRNIGESARLNVGCVFRIAESKGKYEKGRP